MKDNLTDPESFMRLALTEAEKAYERGEVPIGVVMVENSSGQILSQTHNLTITNADPTAHAEILAIRHVCAQQGLQRIPDTTLYVTLEPCPMCAAAISYARIDHIVFGASDPKSGGLVSGPSLSQSPVLHHKPFVTGGILAEACGDILKRFFQERR
mgnify:CR=1 FL=1